MTKTTKFGSKTRLTPSFNILARLDGEVLAQVIEGWPGRLLLLGLRLRSMPVVS